MEKEFFKERDYWSRKHDKKLPLYHGVRTKNPEKIKDKGICYRFETRIDAKKAIEDALKHFGKEKLMRSEGYKGDLIRSFVRSVESPERRVIYLSSCDNEEIPCFWADQNPEFVSHVLEIAGVNRDDAKKYLSEKYGDPHIIEMNETYPVEDRNINSHQRCITPDEIKKIKRCML